jgi:hypothetical protein
MDPSVSNAEGSGGAAALRAPGGAPVVSPDDLTLLGFRPPRAYGFTWATVACGVLILSR